MYHSGTLRMVMHRPDWPQSAITDWVHYAVLPIPPYDPAKVSSFPAHLMSSTKLFETGLFIFLT